MGTRRENLGRGRRNVTVLVLLLAFLLSACGSQAVIPTAQTGAPPTISGTAPAPAVAAQTTAPATTAPPTVMPTATSRPQPASAPPAPKTPVPAPTATVGAATPNALPAEATPGAPEPVPTGVGGGDPFPAAPAKPRVGLPVYLKIPTIGVNAQVEHVGLAPDGAMDVPKDYDNVAWFDRGPRPGEQGNAVIDGHVDSRTRAAVFWKLNTLKPGDEIIVIGDDAVERKFIVTGVEFYKRTEAPLARIFGPRTGAHLNLITCGGIFDRRIGEYDSNWVVYADEAPE